MLALETKRKHMFRFMLSLSDVILLLHQFNTVQFFLNERCKHYFRKMSTTVAPKRQDPNEFLKQIIGRPVVVKLNSGSSDA